MSLIHMDDYSDACRIHANPCSATSRAAMVSENEIAGYLRQGEPSDT